MTIHAFDACSIFIKLNWTSIFVIHGLCCEIHNHKLEGKYSFLYLFSRFFLLNEQESKEDKNEEEKKNFMYIKK